MKTVTAGRKASAKQHSVELPPAVRSIVEADTGDAVFVVGPDYRIVHWDARAESLTGLLAEQMLGKPCYEVVLGEQEDANPFCTHGCPVMHLARADRPVSNYDMRIATRSGQKRWVNISNLTIDSDEGPYLVHLLRDSQQSHEMLEMARSLIRLSSEKSVPTSGSRDIPALTPRQLEVLKLLSEGKTAKDIGKELYLSQATVRNHIRSLLQVLGAHSQLEALAKAHEIGLLSK